jgi:hypothetical protein
MKEDASDAKENCRNWLPKLMAHQLMYQIKLKKQNILFFRGSILCVLFIQAGT